MYACMCMQLQDVIVYFNMLIFFSSDSPSNRAPAPASVPAAWNFSSSSATAAASSASTSSTDSPPVAGVDKSIHPAHSSDSPVLARPRMASVKSQDTSTSKDDSGSSSIPAPPVSNNRRYSRGHAVTKNGNLPTSDTIPTQLSIPLHPASLLNGKNATRVYFGSKSQGSSPILGHRERNSGNSPSQLSLTDFAPSSSLVEATPAPAPQGTDFLQQQKPQDASHSTNLVSPLATTHINAAQSIGGNAAGANPEAIPLAIAVMESCDAIFKGVELEACVVQVKGEVSVSFLASFLPQLASCEPLTFKVNQKNLEVERLLHNQHLLKK